MNNNLEMEIKQICQACENDRHRMMDIVTAVQNKYGQVSSEAMGLIASIVSAHRVEVESVVSFYSFLSEEPKGTVVIRLCNDIIDKMQGCKQVADALTNELGIDFGQTTPDGKITLEYTPCIGMCDQAPAALVNNVPVTNLTPEKVKSIVSKLKETHNPQDLVTEYGDGNNAHDLVKAMVRNNIRNTDAVVFSDRELGSGLKVAISGTPENVIEQVKESKLRGRGGAGFPTGLKWEFTKNAHGTQKYVVCNADEGEPGTFKDRVILTERACILFEGMAIAGYAIGADTGLLYLRGEYAYLRKLLESILDDMRNKNLLGKNILGKDGFNFDIRIQMGAGAYICGEETSLISSLEGLRGDPKTRPPFPAQKGYLGMPTTVNNVETFCKVTRIMEKGAKWFQEFGTLRSTGTKIISVSGDCEKPGVYEIEFGMKVKDMLEMVGAKDTLAVQMGGPSGVMINESHFEETICYDNLATGGSIMVFNKTRNPLEIAHAFMEFFCEESCGYCTPCRVGNVLLKKSLEKIMKGQGEPSDLDYMKELGKTVITASRCGLGQTSPKPILSTLENFASYYENLVEEDENGFQKDFDIKQALGVANKVQGRDSVIYK